MATIARFEVQKWWHLRKNIDGRPIYKDYIEQCVNTIYVGFPSILTAICWSTLLTATNLRDWLALSREPGAFS
jgi:hypothetical protein